MVGQGKDDCGFSLVEERCHNLDKHPGSTYVSDKVSEGPVLNGKIYGYEARFPGMPPSLCIWPTSYQFEVSLHAQHRCYKGVEIGRAVGILPRKVSSENAALHTHKIRLRSGILELKIPTAF